MRKTFKKLLSLTLAATMVVGLAGCGNTASNGGSSDSADKGGSGKTYTVGICQLVQHEALDAATKGFKTALKDKLGDNVKFDEQNAAGDAPTCSTICTSLCYQQL